MMKGAKLTSHLKARDDRVISDKVHVIVLCESFLICIWEQLIDIKVILTPNKFSF